MKLGQSGFGIVNRGIGTVGGQRNDGGAVETRDPTWLVLGAKDRFGRFGLRGLQGDFGRLVERLVDGIEIAGDLHVRNAESIAHLVEALRDAVGRQQVLHVERRQIEQVAERVLEFNAIEPANAFGFRRHAGLIGHPSEQGGGFGGVGPRPPVGGHLAVVQPLPDTRPCFDDRRIGKIATQTVEPQISLGLVGTVASQAILGEKWAGQIGGFGRCWRGFVAGGNPARGTCRAAPPGKESRIAAAGNASRRTLFPGVSVSLGCCPTNSPGDKPQRVKRFPIRGGCRCWSRTRRPRFPNAGEC